MTMTEYENIISRYDTTQLIDECELRREQQFMCMMCDHWTKEVDALYRECEWKINMVLERLNA